MALIEGPLARVCLRREPDRPVFLVGAFRSGTTLVERILCRHPDVASFCYFSNQFIRAPLLGALGIRTLAALGVLDLQPRGFIHNPKLPSNLFSSFECEWIFSLCGRSLWDEAVSSVELASGFADERFEAHLRSLVRRHLWLFSRNRFVNKNPYNSLRMEFLARVFPDALFVRVLRHPLATIDSHLRTQRKLEAALASLPDGARIYRQGLRMDVLSAPAKTAAHDELLRLESIDRRLALAAQWRDFQDAIDAALVRDRSLAARCHTIRYEALMAEPQACIEALLQHLGLDDAAGTAATRASLASLQPELPEPSALASALGPLYPEVRDLLRIPAERLGYLLPDAT